MRAFFWLTLFLAASCASTLIGDTIELANGDLLNGKVVSLSEKELLLQSELLGEMRIARDKVAAITFGSRKPNASVPQPAHANASTAKPSLPQEPSVADVLQQLKKGIPQGELKSLEADYPLLQTPEVKEYFDKTVTGLMKGELSVDHIRQQALEARKQVLELESELGPVGVEALKPYMSILDKFLRETDPKTGNGKSSPVTPVAPSPPRR